jgi:hypothetical protein
MDELEKLAKNAFYLLIGGVSLTVEKSGQILQEIEEQAPIIIDDMIKGGEAKFNEWFNQQPNSTIKPKEKLRRRLFILVKGDWNLAERLLETVRNNNPDRSEDWYWEKVIYDLERDNL